MEYGPPFPDAVREYRFLLDRGYPSSASLKLVGDRRALDKAARMVLFRGVLSQSLSERIASRTFRGLDPGIRAAVDGYNVLFTILNYRRGHPLFIATDGLLRDAGGAHGRIYDEGLFRESADQAAQALAELEVSWAAVFLDSPVSGSGAHAGMIRETLAAAGVPGEVSLAASADPPVRDFEGGAAMSSDSAVAARSRSPVFDLARTVLECRYDAHFPDLREFLADPPERG